MRLLIRGLAVVFSPAFAFASLCLPLVGSAWAGSVALSDVENLTPANTGTHDQFPSLSGSFIAWEGEGDPAQMDPEQIHAAPEIFLWNSETETVWQLTDNTRPDEEPIVREDGHAVWYSCDGQSPQPWECLPIEGQPNTGDTEIMYWNGSMAVPLTDNAFDDGDADIYLGATEVWDDYQS